MRDDQESKDSLESLLKPEEDYKPEEWIFINEYLRNGFNKPKAYEKIASKKTKNISTLACKYFEKPHIKGMIRKLIKETIRKKPAENVAAIAKIANTNVGDYIKSKMLPALVIVNKPLAEVIRLAEVQLQLKQHLYNKRSGEGRYTPLAEKKAKAEITKIEEEIELLKLELQLNPKAFRREKDVVMKPYTYLDIKAMKAAGVKIKSFKETKDGVHVDTYDALLAHRELAKIDGSYAKDNKQRQPNVSVLNFDPLSQVEDQTDTDEGNDSTSEDIGAEEKD